MKYQMWQASNKQWYWHLKAANGEIIAHGEGYVNKTDCERAVNLVMSTNKDTPFYLA